MQISSQLIHIPQAIVTKTSYSALAAGLTMSATDRDEPVIRPGAPADPSPTEYDESGAFGAAAAPANEFGALKTVGEKPVDVPMQAGKASYQELYEEYRNFIGSVVEADRAGGDSTFKRGFVPAGMTQEAAMAMGDYDYMWALEDEMKAALRRDPEWQAQSRLAQQEATYGETGRTTSDALERLQKALPHLNTGVILNSAEYLSERRAALSGDDAFQVSSERNALELKRQLRYVNDIIQGMKDVSRVEGDILKTNDDGSYELGAFSIYFRDRLVVTSTDAASL
jgi:hypothetical protein